MKQDLVEIGLVKDSIKTRKICQGNGLTIDDSDFDLLSRYVGLLGEWNKSINLVSRTSDGDTWFSHILHSLSLLFYISFPSRTRVLDLGSGGGLPGVPLSIIRPDISVTHVDSIGKKAKALTNIVQELGLPNIVINERAERLGSGSHRDLVFDVVIARAVAPLSDLITWSRDLASKRNRLDITVGRERDERRVFQTPLLIGMKGGDLGSEIKQAMTKTGVSRVHEVQLDFDGSVEAGLVDKALVLVELDEKDDRLTT